MRTLAQVLLIALAMLGCGTTPADDGAGTQGGGTMVLPPPTTTPGAAGTTSTPVVPTPVVTPPAGAAGSMAMPVVPPTEPPPVVEPPVVQPTTPMLAMDECGLDTGYAGDEYCINAPDPAKGFQMHIGPSNYANPESRYVLEPGGELTETFTATSGNTTDVFYYWRQYRMRPGSHHLIISGGSGGGGLGGIGGRRLGGSSNSAKDNPEAGVIAPENEGVGMPLAARTALSNSFHTFNFTDQPQLKEAWVNFWYRDAALVKEPTKEVFSMLGMGIAPGQHVNAHGTCNITGSGRFLTTYGHVHANNHRFSVWRTRGTDKMLIHEAYDWEHPNISEYSTTVMNPPLNPTGKVDGGFSGIVDLVPGDKIEFECEIINNTNSVFVGLNEAENDEMCILIGDTVGTSIPTGCSGQNIPVGN
jgi:hypothetical protein